MNSKLDNELNLALNLTEEEREAAGLNEGIDEQERIWELIIRYSGDLAPVRELAEEVNELLGGYAIIYVGETRIESVAALEEIIYMEKPKSLYFEIEDGKAVSCILPLQRERSGAAGTSGLSLSGKGVLAAIVDSGIDYAHPDFRNDDGTTRIINLWDQTLERIFTRTEINEALATASLAGRQEIVPSIDTNGHGTAVAGIFCGNGRASGGDNRGIAYDSEILVVKLGRSEYGDFPQTAQLMAGIDYCIRRAIELGRPVVINISFGNNYGSHSGNSLLESYINTVADIWKSSIVIGTGNEGASGRHTGGSFAGGRGVGESVVTELTVSDVERNINVQLWKNYSDSFELILTSPSGRSETIVLDDGSQAEMRRFVLDGTEIIFYYGAPQPYNILQEIYFEFIPVSGTGVAPGIWKFTLTPISIKDGRYDFWLPASNAVSEQTRFLTPSPETTLTIPSTAVKAISVGAYDPADLSYAFFSGRGYTRNGQIKPDLVAPGVNIMTASVGGRYASRTGTSFATPFVSGGAALLMEWGITDRNDEYLYGEKLKAYLIKGARRLPGFTEYPNPQVGNGALCVAESLPI